MNRKTIIRIKIYLKQREEKLNCWHIKIHQKCSDMKRQEKQNEIRGTTIFTGLTVSAYKNYPGTANSSNGRNRNRATSSNITGTAAECNKYFCSLIKKETRWSSHATGNIFYSKQQLGQMWNTSEQSRVVSSQGISSCVPGDLRAGH